MQVARHHFLAGPRFAEDQHTGVGVGDLLHHLPHAADGPAGTDQAAEQVGLARTAALARLVVHLAIDLGTVQRIEQLVVARRHLQAGQHATTHVFRPLAGHRLAKQQHRDLLVPASQLLEHLLSAAPGSDIAQQYADHLARRGKAVDRGSPVAAIAGNVLFPQKIQNDRQVPAALAIVVNQQEFGFTPHLSLIFFGRGKEKARRAVFPESAII
ncbi:hypothetical protein D9M68_204760 [compost metagenome]